MRIIDTEEEYTEPIVQWTEEVPNAKLVIIDTAYF
tara:strand:+ start:1778 stop:1882 length:105 start_codon:yes stop_codon:yes gene_type:complete